MEEWKTRVTQVVAMPSLEGDAEQAFLVLIYPAAADLGRRFHLHRRGMTLGRVAECDIQLDGDSVSRKHARIEHQDGHWYVVDLESTNGTTVNDQPIARHQLRHGDLIQIGNAIFKFLTGASAETSYHEEIYRMTIIDGLTQAYNKRFLTENLERELARSGHAQRPLSLIMLDIDYFKKINDRYGHLTGDQVLKELARRIKLRLRREDIFARYGGEEFAIVLPDAALETAVTFAEDIRQTVEAEPFEFEGDGLRITVSLGVACTTHELPVDTFIKMADDNLYRAKRGGRNRVMS